MKQLYNIMIYSIKLNLLGLELILSTTWLIKKYWRTSLKIPVVQNHPHQDQLMTASGPLHIHLVLLGHLWTLQDQSGPIRALWAPHDPILSMLWLGIAESNSVTRKTTRLASVALTYYLTSICPNWPLQSGVGGIRKHFHYSIVYPSKYR